MRTRRPENEKCRERVTEKTRRCYLREFRDIHILLLFLSTRCCGRGRGVISVREEKMPNICFNLACSTERGTTTMTGKRFNKKIRGHHTSLDVTKVTKADFLGELEFIIHIRYCKYGDLKIMYEIIKRF